MGAGSSVQADVIPAEIIDLYSSLELIKDEIANNDAIMINKEINAFMKSQVKIRDTLSLRSKAQLRRYIGDDMKVKSKDLEYLSSGIYGKYLGYFSEMKQSINVKLLQMTTEGIGVDLNGLVATLCSLSSSEMMKLSKQYSENSKHTLKSLILGKTKKRSIIQQFLLIVIEENSRNDSNNANPSNALVHEYAQSIYKSTLKSMSNIFNIICFVPRTFCLLINNACMELYNRTLTDLILSKFSGIIAKAMILYTLPLNESYSYVLNDTTITKNENLLSLFFAGFTKYQLLSINKVMQEKYNRSLHEYIESSFNGKLKLFLLSFYDNLSIEGGYEEELDEYVKMQLSKLGMSNGSSNSNSKPSTLIDVLNHPECYEFIKDLLNKQIQTLKLKGYNVHNNLSIKYVSDKGKGKENLNSINSKNDDFTSQQSSVDSKPPLDRLTSLKSCKSPSSTKLGKFGSTKFVETKSSVILENSKSDTHDDDKHVDLVVEYLNTLFQCFDTKKLGFLSTTMFWKYFESLNLGDLGYTQDELGSMEEWEVDNTVRFNDCCNELVDIILTGLENNGRDILSALNERLLSALKRLETVLSEEDTTPPNQAISQSAAAELLRQYIWDTIVAYDKDKSGSLESEELYEMLTVMNLGFTESDVEDIKSQMDVNKDGLVDWEEASSKILSLLKDMISDHRDHWIGLVDHDTKALFWYNLRDQSSQWMSPEDQEAFTAGFTVRDHLNDYSTSDDEYFDDDEGSIEDKVS